MDILYLALTSGEAIIGVTALVVGGAAGFLAGKYLFTKPWPATECSGIPAEVYLHEIEILAHFCPDPVQKNQILQLVQQCRGHDNAAYTPPAAHPGDTHCQALAHARNAAATGKWDLCIGELTHGG
jgi:hypothetical protein